MAYLGESWFGFDRSPRREIHRGKTFEGNNLFSDWDIDYFDYLTLLDSP